MKFLNALEQSNWHVRTLWKIIFLLFFVIFLELFGWMHSQSKIRINIPPYIPESGFSIMQGRVPKETLYSFAFYIWQSINHWSRNGIQDYKRQITNFSPFLTHTFKLNLIKNYNNLLNQGELQDRIRLMQGASEIEYSSKYVRYIGNNTWIVHLKMRLIEMMNANSKIVKDVQMHYYLKVVRYNIDAKENPWGLAISGFSRTPSRIKTII